MNWNRVEGSWKLYKGKIKESWGKLTEDELYVINGRREQLVGRVQMDYRITDDMADASQSSSSNSSR